MRSRFQRRFRNRYRHPARYGFRSGITALLVLGFLLTSARSNADYAWIPIHKKLILRTGVEWNKSSENFDGDGFVAPFSLQGKTAEIRDLTGFVFAEYGVAERWSMWGKVQLVDSAVTAIANGDLLVSGTGLGDTWFGVKHAITEDYPLLTGETFFKLPSGRSTTTALDQLVLGDGNVDWVFRFHVGIRSGPLLFAISPSVWMRFGNYDKLIMLEAATQYNFPYAYARLFIEGCLPITSDAVSSTTSINQTAAGAGGSFMKLAYTPTVVSGGVRLGANFTKMVGAETFVQTAFLGSRTAQNLRFGLNLIFNLDFYEADYRPKVHEVPFTEYDDKSDTFD